MNNLFNSKETESNYDSDDETSNNSNDSNELQCKNIDPSLAKLMDIIIEEQHKVTD
jgi:hypothetical protein